LAIRYGIILIQSRKFRVEGEPRDIGGAKDLALRDRYQFQCWALSLIGAIPVGSTAANLRQVKKGADEGVDGWLRFASGVEGQFEKIVKWVLSISAVVLLAIGITTFVFTTINMR
jgi:hypothetical protein